MFGKYCVNSKLNYPYLHTKFWRFHEIILLGSYLQKGLNGQCSYFRSSGHCLMINLYQLAFRQRTEEPTLAGVYKVSCGTPHEPLWTIISVVVWTCSVSRWCFFPVFGRSCQSTGALLVWLTKQWQHHAFLQHHR